MKPEIDQTSSQSIISSAAFGTGHAAADLYRENSFRLAEVTVDATDLQFKQRIQMLEGAEKMRVKVPPGPGRALPLSPPADAARVRELHRRLTTDPGRRLVEEFFWFWPRTAGGAASDEALGALRKDRPEQAEQIWRQAGPRDTVARHNLAVLEHLRLIEAPGADGARGWTECLDRWAELVQSEELWSAVAARIERLNDARLKSGAARRLRDWLPRGLLAVNAQLGARLLVEDRAADAQPHLAALRHAGLARLDPEAGPGVVAAEAALRREQIRHQCDATKGAALHKPGSGRAAAEQLLAQARGPLRVMAALLEPGDPTRKAAHDEVAEQMRHALIGYNNKTEDWAGSVPLLERALALAATAQTRERIEKDLKVVRENAKETNWWHGPDYWDLPAPVVAELERGYEASEAGRPGEALEIVVGLCAGRSGLRVPVERRPVVIRAVSSALNRKSVRANNQALEVFNEHPPIVQEFLKRAPSQFSNPSFRSTIAATLAGSAAQCPDLLCMICGERIVQGFTIFSAWPQFCNQPDAKVIACPGCAAKFNVQLEEQKAALRRAIPRPLLEGLLAAELNPESPQLQENLRVIKERAEKFGVPIPKSTLPLRLELGIATEDELCAASLSWSSPQRKAARNALLAQYPERYAAFRKTHRRNLTVAWGLAAAACFAVVLWGWWSSLPGTLNLTVVGPDTFEFLVDGRTHSNGAKGAPPKLPPGSHELVVKAKGFRVAQRTIEVAPASEVSWRVELLPEAGAIRPKAEARVLVIGRPDADLARETVWLLDGREVNAADGLIKDVPPGKHQLLGRHRLCEDATAEISVLDQETTDVTLMMKWKDAKLTVQAEKRGDYTLKALGKDYSYEGQPLPMEFWPGYSYDLEVRGNGVRPAKKTFVAIPAANETWSVEFESLQGEIEPEIVIDGGAVTAEFKELVVWKVDGKVTPLVGGRLVNVPAGTHTIEASLPNYIGTASEVSVRDGQIIKARARLVPRPASLLLQVRGASAYTVSIDGAEAAPPNGVYLLAPDRSNKIVVRSPGFLPAERQFTLGANTRETWEVTLNKAPKPKEGEACQVPDLNLAMLWIGPGQFAMGTARGGDANQRPVTQVRFTRGYWLGKTEVTQAQWQVVMSSNPSARKGDTLPVENVSWDDAMDFCRKLTEGERAAGTLPDGYVYTLPTEAQWEYACRAGTTGDYAGDLNSMAWHSGNSGSSTHAVATKQANAWGLHDMHGNVWEWCLDRYSDRYPGGSVTDYAGPRSGSDRVIRGGSWVGTAQSCRSASRIGDVPGYSWNVLGFRLALSSVR
jgi:formylglycine-generating enzyme required for sulfatase activity